jgi:muramidase (phage lysozyme)
VGTSTNSIYPNQHRCDEATANRLTRNRGYIKNANVKAFLGAIAEAEGGDYNLMFGGVKGKKNDKWRFSDDSTHPGAGIDGSTTAAGMYQINKATWKEMSARMGLSDFSAETQDLIAVELLDAERAIHALIQGDVDAALMSASKRWAALPQGPGKAGRYKQPYMKYDEFIGVYKRLGGSVK